MRSSQVILCVTHTYLCRRRVTTIDRRKLFNDGENANGLQRQKRSSSGSTCLHFQLTAGCCCSDDVAYLESYQQLHKKLVSLVPKSHHREMKSRIHFSKLHAQIASVWSRLKRSLFDVHVVVITSMAIGFGLAFMSDDETGHAGSSFARIVVA